MAENFLKVITETSHRYKKKKKKTPLENTQENTVKIHSIYVLHKYTV